MLANASEVKTSAEIIKEDLVCMREIFIHILTSNKLSDKLCFLAKRLTFTKCFE